MYQAQPSRAGWERQRRPPAARRGRSKRVHGRRGSGAAVCVGVNGGGLRPGEGNRPKCCRRRRESSRRYWAGVVTVGRRRALAFSDTLALAVAGVLLWGRRLGCRTPPWRPLLPTSSRPTAYCIFAGGGRQASHHSRARTGPLIGTAGTGDKVVLLGDGNGEFVAAAGLELDGRASGSAPVPSATPAILEDGVVRQLMVEPDPLGVTVSSVDTLLDALCPEPDPVRGSGDRAGSAAAGTVPNAPRWWCTRPRRGRRAHPRPRSRCTENPARHVVGRCLARLLTWSLRRRRLPQRGVVARRGGLGEGIGR
jgi:hypothetical protein